ncbi:hypothetical protein VOLCADRAFT_116495, partial [Volvox carteri f. nagariensis]
MNLCLRAKAVEVVTIGNGVQPPEVPEDSNLRGRAAEMHRQLSHMKEPIVAPRDLLIINLDFEGVETLAEGPLWIPRQRTATSTTASTSVTQSHINAPQANPSPPASKAAAPGSRSCRSSTSSTSISSGEEPLPSVRGGGCGRAACSMPDSELENQRATANAAVAQLAEAPAGPFAVAAAAAGAASAAAAAEWGGGGGKGGSWLPAASGGAATCGGRTSCEGRQAPLTRGFVRVKSVRPPEGLSWTHSRKCLEAVSHILEQRETFKAFLGEDFDQYVRQMERSGTWGDELTLRAVCDSFGLTVHVVTSEEDHWYLTYEPECRKLDREIFLTYIAPIHYNSIKMRVGDAAPSRLGDCAPDWNPIPSLWLRRRSSLKTMALNVSRSFRNMGILSATGPGL